MQCLHGDGDPTNNAVWNLKWGTASENALDRVRHGTHPYAKKTHCPAGHPYDGANTYVLKGRRNCRACKRVKDAAWEKANPEKVRAKNRARNERRHARHTEWQRAYRLRKRGAAA